MSIFSKNDLPAAEERQIRPDAGIVAAELIRCRWLLLIGLLLLLMNEKADFTLLVALFYLLL